MKYYVKHAKCLSLVVGTAMLFAFGAAHAAVSEQQASRLGKDLTPLGGETAGNADGSIPAWTGGLSKPPAGYVPGQHYVDPYPDDKPLFTITAENVEQYKSKLSPGQIALLKAYPQTMSYPVYTTRRSAAEPQWVYDNTRQNATTAELAEGGNGFIHAFGGIPFPIPQSGVEALWNHIARYRGTYVVRKLSEATVQANGQYSLATYDQDVLFKYYVKGGSYSTLNNILFYYLSAARSPARMAGEASLVYETLNQVAEPRMAWGYVPGLRRVRRAPTISYDTPDSGSDGLITVDDRDMFNGSPDRYDWKLVGKKEIYIPYNNYRIASPQYKYDDIIKPGHLLSAPTRFELHRVWVVEGTLRPTARHIYSKRVFYLDEDNWQIALADRYDSHGELWRVSIGYMSNFYNVPTTWTTVDAFYDLQARRYMVQKLENEESKTLDFSQPVPSEDRYKPATLQRMGNR
ncbi:DUF1329 domain-containing protein [Pseudomonas juntendi]|uniref:DUF1329 domain-containing protein n=1 Tax=Pseudomonas juntendi TaxID=2666183 RepID=A0ABZ2JEF3_9PSED|nr:MULTISPECIES: DUF1329 domain-containing protein [Pseudomonas]MDG9873823.1 DUF1329 domain-containing protein [Pseudomonas juntendi]MDH2013269.1 DUF1329 domain-containing protein [Pseudomonas juntendi]QDR69539.1 DUF1329 domain-containing protein [Pseudomonas sp. BJP69]